MALKKAARAFGLLLALALVLLLLRQLPVLRWVVAGAKLVHGLGPLGPLYSALGLYALTMLLVPLIPLIIACGWLYGPWGALLSLPAAVASAATAFSLARALAGRSAARPKCNGGVRRYAKYGRKSC